MNITITVERRPAAVEFRNLKSGCFCYPRGTGVLFRRARYVAANAMRIDNGELTIFAPDMLVEPVEVDIRARPVEA